MATNTRAIAIGMLAGAGVIFVLAGVTVWKGVNRYMAGSALDQHADAVFEGDLERARRGADKAASWLGSDARAALPATDLKDPGSDQELQVLTLRVPGAQRHLVVTARNFGRAARGQELDNPEGMRGSDAALVQHLTELRKLDRKPLPPLPESERYQPPSLAILHHALEQRIHTAWRIGDSTGVRHSASALLMLDPRHPARPELTLVATALDPAATGVMMERSARVLSEDKRVNALRGLITLLDVDPDALGNSNRERRVARLLTLIPAQQRSSEELTRWLASGSHDLEALVNDAARDGSQPVVTAAINRTFAAERYDLAKQLIPKLPQDQQRVASLAVAEYTWDTASLKALSDNPKAHLPRVVAPHLAFDHVAFHVSSSSGAIPRKDVYMKIDGKPVDANATRRFASLIQAPITPGSAEIQLEVLLDEQTIFSGKVRK